MRLVENLPEGRVFAHEAATATGVTQQVTRQWATRGKIHRFSRKNRLTGNGREYKTMYALPEIQQRASSYRATPQRGIRAAACIPRGQLSTGGGSSRSRGCTPANVGAGLWV